MKTIIQRNLPLDKKYSFVKAVYIPLLDGQGCTCDNCGKLIANIVTVRDSDNNTYSIGEDCAKTLLSISEDYFSFHFGISSFDEGKRIRAKLRTALKKNTITGFHYYQSSNGWSIVYDLRGGGSAMEALYYPDITKEYIKDLIK